MEHILTHTFLTEWKKIEQKLEEISQVGLPFETGIEFDGVVIDEQGVYYKSSTYFSGCGTDHFNFCILWEDINKPIEWFKEQADEYKRKRAEQKQRDAEEQKEKLKQQEIQQLKELKEKYPTA